MEGSAVVSGAWELDGTATAYTLRSAADATAAQRASETMPVNFMLAVIRMRWVWWYFCCLC